MSVVRLSAPTSAAAMRVVRVWTLPVVILLAWELAPRLGLIAERYLPPLSEVVLYGVGVLVSGELLVDILVSLARVAAGASIAIIAGTLVGLVVARVSLLGKLVDPLIQTLRVTPVVAAAPLLVLWLGFGEPSKIAIIAAMGFFPMYLSAFTAFRAVDAQLLEVGESLRFTRRQAALLIAVPSALPRLLDGARYALLLGWLSLLIAELIGTDLGLGNLILGSTATANMRLILVATIALAVLTKASDGAFAAVGRRLIPWHPSAGRASPLGTIT